MAIIAMADEAELWGHCFNCGKEGHPWVECTEPLKDSLKRAKERANQKRQSLNRPKIEKPTTNSLCILE